MKKNLHSMMMGKRGLVQSVAFLLLLTFMHVVVSAQSVNAPLRRPVSANSPMYVMHIDTWNYADPQKIINLIPADLRPYVVMNISLSISHDVPTGRYQVAEYGYEIAKSWLRVCAENRMWATIQPASGGMTQARFSDYDLSVFEEFFKTYPNFLGFSYAEQFWGFDAPDDPVSVPWTSRMNHFANLLKVTNKYGGYLMVSWCGNQYSSNINPIGMMKRNPAFAAACKQYSKNYILCEKYTTTGYQSDMESICLGSWLSGFSGNYGMRYDDTGWTDSTGVHQNFTMATFGAPFLEHLMLTGETVIDGPELIWTQCFRETGTVATTDGYSVRNWTTFPQFDNVCVDMFRKVLDGAVRIPTRQEVINRTKLMIVNDVNSGSNDDIYSTPQTLFEGLYRMNGDGNYQSNNSFFKKTGRYPTVPVFSQLADAMANSFQVKVNKSAYATRWPTIASKVNEFNSLFPQEYTGDLYAGRHENNWVVYNPYKTNQSANGRIPFKYNTADSMELTLARYSSGTVKETAGQLKFYLNNYDNVLSTDLKSDTIKIYGSTLQPTWSYRDRASHQASTVSANWSAGVFTLVVQHNGPLDITVNCAGSATGRLTSYTPATLAVPDRPAAYAGPRQYEAEIFEYKNTGNITTSGYASSIRNYTGQGYLTFGGNAAAAVRKTVTVLQPGTYQLQTRYTATGGNITTVDLYVNGVKVITPTFTQTANNSSWNVNSQLVTLNAGSNTIELRANASTANTLVLDNFVISASAGSVDQYHFESDAATTAATNPPALVTTLQSGSAGVVTFTDAAANTSKVLKAYSNGAVNGTGVIDLDLFAGATNYSVTWKEYAATSGGKKGVLLRGNGTSSYATGMKQGYLFIVENNSNNTVTLRPYIANSNSIIPQPVYTSTFTVAANMPCWYRATATGNVLTFECSADSLTWEGIGATAFMDNTYPGGATQFVWGLGASNFSWSVDNITYQAPKFTVNKTTLQGFDYVEGAGPSPSQSFVVSGQSLRADVPVTAPANFEISLNASTGFTNTLTLARVADSVPATTIYVRLKAGLLSKTYKGDVMTGDNSNPTSISLTGSVRLIDTYTFTSDVAATTATTPPAANVTIGVGNGATAGVISYTDAANNTSNYLKIYGVGASGNGTGVLNLDLFPANSADYSVTWKQAVLDATKQYKNGVLLRGSGTGGYTQGMMQGYYFNAFNNSGTNSTTFRIYKSTASGIGSAFASGGATLPLAANTPVWYRASVSGTSVMSLKFEYSTDSITWNVGVATTDNTAPTFASGATQYAWGLFSTPADFYLDNITLSSVPQAADLTVSETNLTGYVYAEGAGPSANQSFTVTGVRLTDDVVLRAPAPFEISLNAASGFANTLTLPQSSGTLAVTTVYARLKTGLAAGNYEGSMGFAYTTEPSSFSQVVTLKGMVSKPAIAVAATSSLNDLGYVASGSSSIVRTFIVSGTTLSQNVNISAPANFEISLNETSGYAATLFLTLASGVVAPTIIYIRTVARLAANTYSGAVNFTSTGADSKSLSVNGTVAAQAAVYASETSITGLNYNTYTNTPPVKSFLVWGTPLAGDLTVTAPANFEIARTNTGSFSNALSLPATNNTVDSTLIYVRLKASLAEGVYSGNATVASSTATSKLIALGGTVSSSRVYDFIADVATNAATTPPAQNVAIATGNGATAGVVNYAFTGPYATTSNSLRPYSGGARNATGVMDLSLFPTDATDYAVSWKQAVGTENTDYKAGVLLRGGPVVGTNATTGYVQGIRSGYVFIVFNNPTAATKHSEFRIYRSTTATGLDLMVNINNVNALVPTAGQPVWYRASVSGSSPVTLKFEYSIDSLNWNLVVTQTDATNAFTTGATQIVYGLGTPNYNFYMDDISMRNSSALPVSLLSFAAKAVGEKAVLDWKTATETANKGFEVEHGTDGRTFSSIGFVSGNGNSTTTKAYTFTHLAPTLGINYYRLRQIDADGNSHTSGVQTVIFNGKAGVLSLLQNPVHNEAILNLVSSTSRNLVLKLADANGKTVLQRQWMATAGSNTFRLNTNMLASGMYTIQVADAEGSSILKMLKQ